MALTGLIPIGRMPIDYLSEGTRGINDIMNRVRAAALEQQRINDMVNYHKSSIGLQGAAGQRAQDLMPYQVQALQDAHMRNQLQFDPEAQANYFRQMMGNLSGAMPEQGIGAPVDQGMDNDPWGPSTPEQQAAFESRGNPQQSPSQQSTRQPIDFKALARHPMGQMMLKSLGLNPQAILAETPEEKTSRALNLNEKRLKQKEEFDKAKEARKINSDIPLTNAMKTQLQNIISGVPKVNKKIDDLIKAPSPTTIIGYKSNERAEHSSLVLEAAESYAKAKGWPNTNESIKAAREILDRHLLESDVAYRRRLEALKKSLNRDFKDARETLHPIPEQLKQQQNENKDPLGLGF